jgi:uncharacterized protein (TIGR03083 family)
VWSVTFLRIETRQLFPKIRVALLGLLGDLTPQEWDYATACKGWDVKDVGLHLLGVEIGNVSRRRDGVGFEPHPGVPLGEWLAGFNEEWVRAARRISPPLLRDLLNTTGRIFERYLETLDLDALTGHVSWASDGAVPVWLDIAREYTERWVHQQQIRDATNRPGLKEPEFIRPVLQAFVHALPVTYRDVGASKGTVVQLKVTGSGGGTWHLSRVDDGWMLSAGEHTDPVALVTMDADAAWRLFTRNPRAGSPAIEGDELLGGRIKQAVAIIA